MWNFVRALDPRRSLSLRIAMITGLLFLLSAAIGGWLTSDVARRAAERDAGTLHAQFARQLADALDEDLQGQLQKLQTLANLIPDERLNTESRRTMLQDLQTANPEFAWIGISDVTGDVMAATGKLLEGNDVSQRAWFLQGKMRPYIGDVHEVAPLAELLPADPNGEPLRFVDVATPLKSANGAVIGVLGAQLSWSWIRQIEQQLLAPLRARLPVTLFIINANGRVLLGEPSMQGQTIDLTAVLGSADDTDHAGYYTTRWPDGNLYVTGFARQQPQDNSLEWTILVREAASVAFADATHLQERLLLFALGTSVMAAAASAWVIRRLTRPLNQIADAADQIRLHTATDIPIYRGDDEVARVSHSLNSLVGSLEAQNHELQHLNSTLEDRVRERTQQIERLSEENKLAAVESAITQERLRMARDLHDTLAHTLAGLLTQIRLVSKLAAHNLPSAAVELIDAEKAAQQGLHEARTAISNLRENPARELGLTKALEVRLDRFAQRNGIAVAFDAADDVPILSDSRSETLYRILEEALHNIEKHADAKHVWVLLMRQSPQLVVQVRDDGVGFDPSATTPGHFGLRGMREQAALIGAQCDVISERGAGTCVAISLALVDPHSEEIS